MEMGLIDVHLGYVPISRREAEGERAASLLQFDVSNYIDVRCT